MFENIWKKIQKEYYETLKNFGIKPKEKPTMMTEQKSTYEISLVPEVKRRMIKAMKFRNILLFCCIVLMSVSGGVVVMMITVWEGQNITMSGQDGRIKTMSEKIKNYSSLSEFLTIQKQLEEIGEINNNKKVLSRVFPVLSVILPEGPDTISLSELTVNLEENTLVFDAQADAKVSPYIDYRVLESFRKSVSLMKYDYGRYVTDMGEEIPSRCLVEADADGNTLVEEEKVGSATNKYIYAYWQKGKKGCDPARDDYAEEETETVPTIDEVLDEFTKAEEEAEEEEIDTQKIQDEFNDRVDKLDDYGKDLIYQQISDGVTMEQADVIKVYRSPKFSDWYKEGYMTPDGAINGVPHFESQCITYSGAEANGTMKWISNNDCMLSAEDPSIRDSSNGRDSNGNLVLRFSATLTLDSAVFEFKNKHVMAISPTGQNVTDSYRQIEGMFEERAADCSDSDVICTTTSTDSGGSE